MRNCRYKVPSCLVNTHEHEHGRSSNQIERSSHSRSTTPRNNNRFFTITNWLHCDTHREGISNTYTTMYYAYTKYSRVYSIHRQARRGCSYENYDSWKNTTPKVGPEATVNNLLSCFYRSISVRLQSTGSNFKK